MAHVIVLGAGLSGLSTAMLLARDGHDVTVLERDPAAPPSPDQAWQAWQRPGVNQFRLPHLMAPRWRLEMEAELPEVVDALATAGGLRTNLLHRLPAAQRGEWRDGDERFETVTARRPVLEAVFAAAADRAPRVTARRGVKVTGVATNGSPPRVTGVLAEGGHHVRADLVVDCGGRRSALPAWLEAAGARPPREERADCGFVYYCRHFRSPTGALPEGRASVLQRYESASILTLPGDNGTWSVALITSARDRALRGLREPARWDAALDAYPLVAHWRDGEPTSGVSVIAGIEDRCRTYVVDGEPVATGVVAVGDAWACTNPSLGRGATMGLLHAIGLRDALRETGDPEKVTRRFHDWTASTMEPLYRATLWYDRHRLAELDADAAGVPYQLDDPRWTFSLATFAASLADPDVARAYQSLASLLASPEEIVAQPGLPEKIMRLGAGAPTYPLPGARRRDLLAVVDG